MLDKNYLYNKWMDIFYSIYFSNLHLLTNKHDGSKIISRGATKTFIPGKAKKTFPKLEAKLNDKNNIKIKFKNQNIS